MPRNTVALGVRVPQYEGSSINPLAPVQMMEGFARIQNMQNQNRLFQQEFAAKQRIGEIMSIAKDPETGYAMAMQDPVAAPFAPQAFSAFRTGMLALRQYNESIAKDARTGFDAVIKSAPMGFYNPALFQSVMQAQFSMIPKDAQDQASTAFNLLQKGLFTRPPGMTDQQYNSQIQQNFMALGIGSGAIDPEKAHAFWGVPAPGEVKVPGPYGETPAFRSVDPMTGRESIQTVQPLPGQEPPPAPAPAPATAPATATTIPGPQSSAEPTATDTSAGTGQQASNVPTGQQDTVIPSPGDYTAPASAVEPAAYTGGGSGQLVTPAQASQSDVPAGQQQAQATPSGGQIPIAGQIPVSQTPYAHGVGPAGQAQIDLEKEQTNKLYEEMRGDAKEIPVVAARLNLLQDSLRQFPAGGWASTKAQIQQWIQGFGKSLDVDDGTIRKWMADINSGGNLAAQQIFQSEIAQYATDQLRQASAGTGAGRIKAEVMSFLQGISSNTDPLAIEQMLNGQGRQMLQIGADRVNKFTGYMHDSAAGKIPGYRPQDFDMWYNSKSLDPDKLPMTYGAGRGIPIGPRDPYEAMGAGGSTVVIGPDGTPSMAPTAPAPGR